MSKLTIMVGPPSSGKSTYAKKLISFDKYRADGRDTVYINQDSQGKEHLKLFEAAVKEGKDIVVDRLNFSKAQRARYIGPARTSMYEVEIVVLHENYETCLKRCLERKDHETIKDEDSARSALNMFFSKYERPTEDECDFLKWIYTEDQKPPAVICDIDGTLCNVEHRLHHVRGEGKKDWNSFFKEMVNDTPNLWCLELVEKFSNDYQIVFCSGRPDSWRPQTVEWLAKYGLHPYMYKLYMRPRSDSRNDSITKEVLLDFEILTRFEPFFFVDDRKRVVDVWRRRGYVCLACHDGDF